MTATIPPETLAEQTLPLECVRSVVVDLPPHAWTDQPQGRTSVYEQRVWTANDGAGLLATSLQGTDGYGRVCLVSLHGMDPLRTPEEVRRYAACLLAAADDAEMRFGVRGGPASLTQVTEGAQARVLEATT